MNKLRILHNNLADADAADVAISSEDSEWPVENIQNVWPTYYSKTDSLGAPDYWEFDLGSALPVSYFIFWNHNFTADATVSIKADLHESGWVDVDESLTYDVDFDDRILVYHFPTPISTCRFWRLEVTDPTNPDEYLRGGYAFVGGYFQPRYSFAAKSGGVVDPSIIHLSDGGQPFVNEKDAYERFNYSFSCATPADLVTLIDSFKVLKKGRPFFIIEDSDDPLGTIRYVRHSADFGYSAFAGGYKSFNLAVEETR